ncbi:outer membrane beta-barrel protein [uncultured Cytophaga sp.]|uniref:outer membrane beta-barrel protein n=1 Tax=uncultured Cytophaga sp. TaxID=160238 RepID=UPI00260EB3FB|nr:outer membrane beta-barrel protein [uncultured Cytophaga sp.]
MLKTVRHIFFIYAFLFLSLNALQTQAQVDRKKSSYTGRSSTQSFEKTQFYIGIRGGINLTEVHVVNPYSSFVSPTNSSEEYLKSYKSFSKPSAAFGLEFSFSYTKFTASFQPNYRRQTFSYSNTYEWADASNSQNYLQLSYNQKTSLDYIELPLFIRYDIVSGAFKPFVQVGFYYGILNNATKELTIEGVDNASGTSRNFTEPSSIIGAKNLYIKSSIGAAFGLGTSYKVGNVRLIVDATYRMGLNNISNVKNRYTSNALSGVGDVTDDIKLNNITFSFGCLFPMKFLVSPSHKAVD